VSVVVDIVDREEKDLWEAASAVLSFYGSEATSHGSIAVGFFLAFFALLQVRKDLAPYGFDVTMYVVILGVVFSGLRVIYYGTLSAVITSANVPLLEEFVEWVKLKKSGTVKRGPHALLHEFCRWGLTKVFIRGRLFERVGYQYAASFGLSFVILLVLEYLGFGGDLLPWIISHVKLICWGIMARWRC